uniref:Uncharacterized protein n=1 Tax=Anguilla anguilla TaxID=7936 RepID=A0A0E9QLP9_ANGAN
MPRRDTCSFRNSLWSCSRMGVWFIGEKPMAGRPTALINRLSEAAGNISFCRFIFIALHVALKIFHQGLLSSVDVRSWLVCFCANSYVMPSPASLHHR